MQNICTFLAKFLRTGNTSESVKRLTVSRTLACAREPSELRSGAHEPQPACPTGVLIRSTIHGVDGAAAMLQPLTVKQRLHHVEKVQGEDANVARISCTHTLVILGVSVPHVSIVPLFLIGSFFYDRDIETRCITMAKCRQSDNDKEKTLKKYSGSEGVRNHIGHYRRWSQSRSTSFRKSEDREALENTSWMEPMPSGSFVMLSKTCWNMFVPRDNVTLAYKFLRMSKSRGLHWLQRFTICSQNTRAKETFGSSNNTEYFLLKFIALPSWKLFFFLIFNLAAFTCHRANTHLHENGLGAEECALLCIFPLGTRLALLGQDQQRLTHNLQCRDSREFSEELPRWTQSHLAV